MIDPKKRKKTVQLLLLNDVHNDGDNDSFEDPINSGKERMMIWCQ